MAQLIRDFHELGKPRSDSGQKDGNHYDWCTCDQDASHVYYLLNDGTYLLADLLSGLHPKEFYFKTEVKCHEHTAAYYMKHGKIYPYSAEWTAALNAMVNDSKEITTESPTESPTESQVMEFI